MTTRDGADDKSLKDSLSSRIEVWNLVQMSKLRMFCPIVLSWFFTISHLYQFVDILSQLQICFATPSLPHLYGDTMCKYTKRSPCLFRHKRSCSGFRK